MIPLQKILPSRFVHFRSPVDNAPVFLKKEVDGKKVDDREKPVGIRIYGPGSAESRKADAIMTQELIDAKLKKGNAEMTQRLLTEKLARLSIEFVNFEIDGKTSGFETFRAFYDDPGYSYLRDQIEEGQSEVADFLPKD